MGCQTAVRSLASRHTQLIWRSAHLANVRVCVLCSSSRLERSGMEAARGVKPDVSSWPGGRRSASSPAHQIGGTAVGSVVGSGLRNRLTATAERNRECRDLHALDRGYYERLQPPG